MSAEQIVVGAEWTPYSACEVVEGFGSGADADEETQLEAWQYLVNQGLVWSLQGWYGRTAAYLIEQGLILTAAQYKAAEAVRKAAEKLEG